MKRSTREAITASAGLVFCLFALTGWYTFEQVWDDPLLIVFCLIPVAAISVLTLADTVVDGVEIPLPGLTKWRPALTKLSVGIAAIGLLWPVGSDFRGFGDVSDRLGSTGGISQVTESSFGLSHFALVVMIVAIAPSAVNSRISTTDDSAAPPEQLALPEQRSPGE